MDLHYICTGTCGASQATPGMCGDESCPMYNLEFNQCDCQDGQHREALFQNDAGGSTSLEDGGTAHRADRFDDDEIDFR